MAKVCRLCLSYLSEDSKYCSINSVESSCRYQLTILIPEMALDLIPDPVICNICRQCLKSAYEFKTRCLEVEESIRKLIDAHPDTQDFYGFTIVDAKTVADPVIDIKKEEIDKTEDCVNIKREPIEENVKEFVVYEPTSLTGENSQCLVKDCWLVNTNHAEVNTQNQTFGNPEGNYICNFCNLSFKTLQTLRQHNARCKRRPAPSLNVLAKKPNLPSKAKSHLKKWLFKHKIHPYPDDLEKQQLMKETNLSLLQVENWFINARRRILQNVTTFKRRRGKALQ